MCDQEFEELRDLLEEPSPQAKATAMKYKLVHAITPLEENKSFLEKVQLGEMLCGIQEENSVLSNTRFGTQSRVISAASKKEAPPPRNIWSSSEDDDSDIEAVNAVTARKPLQWEKKKPAKDAASPRPSSNNNNNTMDAQNLRNGGGGRVNSGSYNGGSSHGSEQQQQPRRRRRLPEIPKDKKPLEKIHHASILEELRDATSPAVATASSSTAPLSSVEDRALLDSLVDSQVASDLSPAFILHLVKSSADPEDGLNVLGRHHAVHQQFQQQQQHPAPHQQPQAGPNSTPPGTVVQHVYYDSGNSTSHSPDEAGQRTAANQPLLNNAEFFTDADLTEELCSPLSSVPGGPRHTAPHLHTHQLLLPDKLELLDPTHRGLHRFVPRHTDEIEVDIGDPVYVQKEAEDLWCEGANLRTGHIGIFPLAHVVDVDYNDFDPTGSNPNSDRKERYLLEYIGSVESSLYKGNAVLCQAVKKILGAKEAPKRHACVLEISDKGIKMIDKSKINLSKHPSQDFFYSLKNVTFCGFHPSNSLYFGFVTKHPRLPKYACHVFIGETSTQHIAEACGRAFNRFYQKFIETAYPVEDIYLE